MKKFRLFKANNEEIHVDSDAEIFILVNEDLNYLCASTIKENVEAFKVSEFSLHSMLNVGKDYLSELIFEFDTPEELEKEFMEYLI